MEIVHRVTFSHEQDVEYTLKRLEVDYFKLPGLGGRGFVGFLDIPETDPRWPQVERIIRTGNLSDLPTTVFSQQEVLDAEWLRAQPTFQRPHLLANHLDHLWSERERCSDCPVQTGDGGGLCLGQDPTLNGIHIVASLTARSLFIAPEVLESFVDAGLNGYQHDPVIVACNGESSPRLVQLQVLVESSPGLVVSSPAIEFDDRSRFHVTHEPFKKGRISYRRDALPHDSDFALSHELFGSGKRVFREIFVSNRVARVFLERGWLGVDFHPLELR